MGLVGGAAGLGPPAGPAPGAGSQPQLTAGCRPAAAPLLVQGRTGVLTRRAAAQLAAAGGNGQVRGVGGGFEMCWGSMDM